MGKNDKTFIPINSGKIIIPAIIVVYLLTVCLTAVINTILILSYISPLVMWQMFLFLHLLLVHIKYLVYYII